MKYHPDRNQGDTAASKKFTDVASAYETLSDTKKRKQYDMFGVDTGHSHGSRSGSGSGFEGFGGFDGSQGSAGEFSGFEDIFSQFGGGASPFGGGQGRGRSRGERESPEPEAVAPSLDVEVTKQIHLFDFLLGTKVTVETVYSKQLTLTIKPGTQPGTKFKIS